jgi:hypothetical protein
MSASVNAVACNGASQSRRLSRVSHRRAVHGGNETSKTQGSALFGGFATLAARFRCQAATIVARLAVRSA